MLHWLGFNPQTLDSTNALYPLSHFWIRFYPPGGTLLSSDSRTSVHYFRCGIALSIESHIVRWRTILSLFPLQSYHGRSFFFVSVSIRLLLLLHTTIAFMQGPVDRAKRGTFSQAKNHLLRKDHSGWLATTTSDFFRLLRR